MSSQFYAKMWIATKKDLQDAILRDQVMRHLEPTKNRSHAHKLIGNLYARYIVLCNNLAELYDQTLQVQKRTLIEKLLISSQERLEEIQRSICKIEMSQFVFVDDALIELRLSPYDIQFLRPFYLPRKRNFECQKIIENDGKDEPEEVIELKGLDRFRKILTREELEEQRENERLTRAVNAIKAHEKARQARVFLLNIQNSPDRINLTIEREEFYYDFKYREDNAGIRKIKRTKFKELQFNTPAADFECFDYYSPPEFRINRLGKKVLVPKTTKSREHCEELRRERLAKENQQSEVVDLPLAVEDKILENLDIQAIVKNQAALIIQRNFLYYNLRKKIKKRKLSRLQKFNVVDTVDLEAPDIRAPLEEYANKRRERKKEFDETFLKALEDEKARILKLKSEFIMEDITEDIRAWFREFYTVAGDFHRYPEDFEGGTIMVMRGEIKTPEEWLIEKSKTPKEKAKERQLRKKAKKSEKEKLLAEKKRQLKLKDETAFDFSNVEEWKALDTLEAAFIEGQSEWQSIDDLKNRKELPIWEWVTIDAYCDVHKELRAIVDELMRVEHQLLRFALSVDKKKPFVPQKKKKPKKSRKKKKKKEERPVVDVFEERSAKECYDELREMNILRVPEKKSLNDFIGDCSYAMVEYRVLNKDPPPRYGDVKNYIQTQILGKLGKLKSFCIIGPQKCGKKFLVEALCNEMGALIFDLSAPKIKEIEDMPNFLNLVLQVAVKFQPSVLFIDGAHKPFIRRISGAEASAEKPRKLGPFLFREVFKRLNSEDAVMLIGVTNEPWNCNFRSMRYVYEKFAVFPPKIDHGTALKAWQTGLRASRVENFDATPLAEFSREFSVGDIVQSINSCIDIERRVIMHRQPLTCRELMENLITTKQPIQESTVKQFSRFVAMLDPFVAIRRREMKRAQEEIDKARAEKEMKTKMKEKKKS